MKQQPPWGANNTRQPCPCPHLRSGEAQKIDESGKCARCKTKQD